MKKYILLFISVLSLNLSFSQSNGDAVLMTLEDEKITVKDFEYIFKKNSTDETVTKESLDEYIELFVNYKLKVKAAKDAKLDTNSAFIGELKGYRKQLARPYLIDGDLLDKLTKEAYERKKTEISARHILIRLSPEAEPQDTLRAWNKIEGLRKRIVGGEDFVTVAKSKGGSEDPSVRDNGGYLGFFSAFQMVYPFEEAAYTTKEGDVSPILRTRYGYHILEVIEKREARGQVKVAHIMTKSPQQSSPEAKERARTKIFEIYEKYKNGESFDDLVRKFSEDGTTSKNGGELPWFGTRKMVKVFEDVSFELENPGDVSEPFETEYGWHIVKKIDEKTIASFDELESEIKGKVRKDSRADVTKTSFLNKLKNEYSVSPKSKSLKYYNNYLDSTFFTKEWSMPNTKKLKKTALKIEKQKYTLADYNAFMIKNKRRAKTDNATEYLNSSFESWVDKELMDYEDARLEQKHEPFRMLMQEYRDGILLFELTDQLVWSKAISDTTGLKDFHEKNKSNYLWPERYNVELYSAASKDMANEILKLVNEGLSSDSILTVLNKESSLNVNLNQGIFSAADKPVLEKSSKEVGVSQVVQYEGRFFVIKTITVIPEKEKELSEAKGIITSDYQGYLEKQWINELRNKYNYTINKDVLYSLAND